MAVLILIEGDKWLLVIIFNRNLYSFPNSDNFIIQDHLEQKIEGDIVTYN